MKKTIKVTERTGFWWGVLFWVVVLAFGIPQILCMWLGKGFTVLSDIQRELLYQVAFKPKSPNKNEDEKA